MIDRLLVSAQADARSYERFDFIAKHTYTRVMATHYAGYVKADSENYATYIDLATEYQDEKSVFARLDDLAAYEATLFSEDRAKLRLLS